MHLFKQRIFITITGYLLLISIGQFSLYAETPDTTRVYQLQNVVIEEKSRPNTKRSGSPLQILSIHEIQQVATPTLSDAVRRFSGISIKDYGGIGGLKTISIRGLGANHTAVSYDGIAMSNCQSGQIDISRFSLNNISEIALTMGQNENIYQTARMAAAAGALHLETRQPVFNELKKYQFRANLSTGSYGLANSSIFYNYSFSSKFAVTAHAEYLRANGIYSFSVPVGKKEISGKRNNSDIESWQGEVNLFSKISDKQDLKFKISFLDSERGLPGAVIIDNPYSTERLFDRNYYAQLGYEYRTSPVFKMKSALKWNYTRNRNYNNVSSGIRDDRFTQTESYATVTAHYTPLQGLSFSLSEDFSYNDLVTNIYEGQNPERFTSLTSLAAQYQNSRFNITASLLNTFSKDHVKTGQQPKDIKKLSPAVSLSVRPFAESTFRIRASYKDIFRVPTFNDMYYLVIGNANLKPEKARQGNLGITWSGSATGWIDYISCSVDGYYNRIHDKIVAIPTMFIWRMSNADKTEALGTDIVFSIEKQYFKNIKMRMSGTYNFLYAVDISNPDFPKNQVWRHQLPYTPKHSGSGTFTVETPWVNLGYAVHFASIRYMLPQNNSENQMDRYSDHSVSLDRTFKLNKHSFRIQVSAQNLGNRNYEIIKSYPMPPRNYRVSLHYSF